MTYNRTPRRRFTDLQRKRFFEEHHGVCYLCRAKIDGVREKWEIEHVIAREIMGEGADEDANLALVHASCHKVKTAADKAAIGKSNRIRAKHIGARLKGRSFPEAKPQNTATRKVEKWSLL